MAIDKLPWVAGTGVYPVFDLAAQTESMRDIFDTFADSVGYKGKVQLVGAGGNAFAQAMSVTGNIASGRAKSLLGWFPKRASFVQGMEVYAKAFVAH
jgi:nucleoside-diphosphate-sugar epimerase